MIEVIDNINALRQMEEEWCGVAQSTGNPLLQFEWFFTCAEAFSPDEKLHIVLNRSGGKINAIAPLAQVKGPGGSNLDVLGAKILCEPTGFIYTEEGGLRELIAYIVRMRRPTYFRRFDLDAKASAMLIEQSKARLHFSKESASPWIPIDKSWAEYEKKMSSRDRYTIRRCRKRAEERGKVEIEVTSPAVQDVPRLMEEVFRVESLSWKERAGTGMKMGTNLGRFFYNYALTAASKNMLRISFMRINSHVIAFQFSVVYANRIWVLKIGFDESFAHCSPGTLLMHETIRYAFDRNLEAYELLGTDEPWLHMWAKDVRHFMSIHVYPVSAGGMINLLSDASVYIFRRIPSAKDVRGVLSKKA